MVAADTFGRAVGVIFEEAGLSGRGGRLMRSVSRLGAFESEPSEAAESAIVILFYSYFGKCSMAKFAIVTFYPFCPIPFPTRFSGKFLE